MDGSVRAAAAGLGPGLALEAVLAVVVLVVVVVALGLRGVAEVDRGLWDVEVVERKGRRRRRLWETGRVARRRGGIVGDVAGEARCWYWCWCAGKSYTCCSGRRSPYKSARQSPGSRELIPPGEGGTLVS